MQDLVERRREELSRVEAEIDEARAGLEQHDAAVRQRAAELEAASEKLAAEEERMHSARLAAEQEAAETRALASKAADSERAAEQVLTLSMEDEVACVLLLCHRTCAGMRVVACCGEAACGFWSGSMLWHPSVL